MITDRMTMKTETIFSDDRQHRYLLRKEWDAKKPRATVIMTNPSTADILTMDYTTMYILNNLAKLGYGGVEIVNLVSKPTTKLKITEGFDSMSDENTNVIMKSAEKSDSIIIAWGKIGENNKKVRDVQNRLLSHLEPFRDKLYEIASDRGDSGFHPLAPQIRFSWTLKKFEISTRTEKKKEA